MKTIIYFLTGFGLSVLLPQNVMADPFEDGMRQAFTDYKKGDNEAVSAKLRDLLKIMDEKGAAKVGGLLPDAMDAWKGETVKREDVPGGGVSMSRVYVSGAHRITVKVIKDSPLVAQLLPLLANEELIKMTNRKTHRIAGETAIMEGEHKLQVVLDERIYVEFEGDEGTGETELVSFATKIDLAKLGKLK
ncbi:MAG: hypothetical protein ABIS50_26470 [Luteolibacter sp.]|uniref:hypothetical protein n=1 Tax=Luteolibacter sp. TaxID=1962973 RepID=UPI003266E5D4